jgi:hypothetical protein
MGDDVILRNLEALRELFPGARIRPSNLGLTWQVWTDGCHLSVPLHEPTLHPERTRARVDHVRGKTGRFELEDMRDAGIEFDLDTLEESDAKP